MKIHHPETGTYVETRCTGCMCHEMAMVFGSDPDRCAECGCPKTLAGWESANACPSCGEQMVNGTCEDCEAASDNSVASGETRETTASERKDRT